MLCVLSPFVRSPEWMDGWIGGVGWTGFVWHSLGTDFAWLFKGQSGLAAHGEICMFFEGNALAEQSLCCTGSTGIKSIGNF